jgi:heme exporter protein A
MAMEKPIHANTDAPHHAQREALVQAAVGAPGFSAPPLLEARGVACQRGGRRLLANFNLTLPPGRLVWLRGDNGRGKTSLLRLLAGLVEPDAGQVLWQGQAARKPAARAAQPLYVAHANALKDDLTVAESLAFLATLGGAIGAVTAEPVSVAEEVSANNKNPQNTTAEVLQALARVGMAPVADRPVRTLSQGQRRRAALARLALPRTAAVWLLDEPFDALDTQSTQALNTLLHEHIARGGSVVLTSHQDLAADAPQAEVCRL